MHTSCVRSPLHCVRVRATFLMKGARGAPVYEKAREEAAQELQPLRVLRQLGAHGVTVGDDVLELGREELGGTWGGAQRPHAWCLCRDCDFPFWFSLMHGAASA